METKAGDLKGLAQTSTAAMEPTEGGVDIATKPSAPASVEDAEIVSDPEEDDLDDLDDLLDEFSATDIDIQKTTSQPSGAGGSSTVQPSEDILGTGGLTDEDFAKQLQAGMAGLLGEMETSAEMQAQFESMLKELGGGLAPEGEQGIAPSTLNKEQASLDASTKVPPSAANEESFQETIKKTIERMQASGEQATAAAAADDSNDILAELMKQMQGGGLDGEGSEEDFSKMLMGLMEQLTNKDILYEPMKELDDKFPEWMEKNKSTTSKEDLARYEEQQSVVREIVAKFEEKAYNDSNAADREYIVDRMQKMQAAGAPPPDLVGEMAAAQEAFGGPDEGCPQQ